MGSWDLERDDVNEFPHHFWDGDMVMENCQLFPDATPSYPQPHFQAKTDLEEFVAPCAFLAGSVSGASFRCLV